jgi:hypothetical protein
LKDEIIQSITLFDLKDEIIDLTLFDPKALEHVIQSFRLL